MTSTKFGDLSPKRQKELSSKGGRTKHGPTGFALLDKDKLKELSRKGGLKSKRPGKIKWHLNKEEELPPFKEWYAKTKDYGGTKEEYLKLKVMEEKEL